MEIKIRSTSAVATIETFGAELKSVLDVMGTEYMWQADDVYWDRTSPFLFPNISGFPDGTTYIKGKKYAPRNHGFARDMDFRVLIQSDDRVVLSITDTPESHEEYPFKFMLQITYEIHDCIVDVTYKVMNTGDETMYYCIGAHPGFNVPMVEGDKFTDYRISFEEEETINAPIANPETGMFDDHNRKLFLENGKILPLSYEVMEKTILMDTLKTKSVQLDSIKTGRGVKVCYEGFEQVALWTKSEIEAPFLCIEPWCGSGTFSCENGNFEDKRGVQVLEEDESKIYKMSIILL